MEARSHIVTPTRAQKGGFEYGLYFALVFTISLLPALAQMVVPKAGQAREFFVTKAWSMAGEVTPKIFSLL